MAGVGRRLAEKIAEIVETGDLRKLDEMSSREDLKAIRMFTGVYGVGPAKAELFVNQGFRSLDDLLTKVSLTRTQKIGIKHYEDFLERIPRQEAALIEKTVISKIFSLMSRKILFVETLFVSILKVKEAALELNEGLVVTTCGSYRRGKPSCGDVDILITHPDGHSHKGIFSSLLDSLHKKGLTYKYVLRLGVKF